MANRNSPQTPPTGQQVPLNLSLGIEIPLGLPDYLPEQKMTNPRGSPK